MIDSFTQDADIRSLLVKFLKSLLEKSREENRPMYYSMFVARINKLREFDENEWISIINNTLNNSWKNFYKPENENKPSNKFRDNAVSETYTDEELAEIERLNEERKANGLQTQF